jgi:hypothetical protein
MAFRLCLTNTPPPQILLPLLSILHPRAFLMSLAENDDLSRFRWQKTSVAEFAGFERNQGEQIVEVNNIYWRQVRPFFFRPLLPFREYQPEAAAPPLRSHFGGCQFAVPRGSRANSFLNVLLFRNAETYSPAALDAPDRRQIRSAAKAFTIREITDVNEFKEKAFPIYGSFYQRTKYSYKNARLKQSEFSRWAESLFHFKKLLILGACRNERLEAISISQLVDDTVVYSTLFYSAVALRLNVSSLLLHSLRQSVASGRQAGQIFVGMYKYGAARGINDFYLGRGCSLVQKPAFLRVNPLVMSLLRAFRPGDRMKLVGTIEDTRIPTSPLSQITLDEKIGRTTQADIEAHPISTKT